VFSVSVGQLSRAEHGVSAGPAAPCAEPTCVAPKYAVTDLDHLRSFSPAYCREINGHGVVAKGDDRFDPGTGLQPLAGGA
jgi:hypothetical protein